MRTGTIADINGESTTAIYLPSGISVKIRRLVVGDFIGLGEIKFPCELSPQPEIDDRVIASACINPKFTDSEVHDLCEADFRTLASEILKYSGFVKEVAASSESFALTESARILDLVAERYKILPSQMIHLTPAELQFNFFIAYPGLRPRNRQA